MISEATLQRYGCLVARAAADRDGAEWEHVAHALLDMIEAQDAALDELRDRLDAVEARGSRRSALQTAGR